MKENRDKLYINNEVGSEALYTGEYHKDIYVDQVIYANGAPGSEALVNQSLYQNSETGAITTRSVSVSKKTSKVSVVALSVIGSALGITVIVNPLVTRPSIAKGAKYQLVGSTLSYDFSLSTRSNYECHLILYLKDKEVENLLLKEQGKYQGEFTLKDHGDYHLDLYATNNFDYRNNKVLYKFTF